MKVVFRVDASVFMGTGHLMRCLTLAEELRKRGADARFICRAHHGNLIELLQRQAMPVTVLPASERRPEVNSAECAAWLGTTWQEDAEQTLVAIEASGVRPDWLVVDHYAVDQRWERALRTSVWRIMAIDDLADRAHDCDLLLDQNLVAARHTRYRDKVPDVCGLLLGPEYALLQTSFAELYDRVPPREGSIRRIFIFFGGADTHNLTGRALNAFLSLNRSDIQVDVVIAPSGPYAKNVRFQVAAHNNIHLHSGLSTLAPLMARADLAIGAGGSTSWERLCLGLPALVVTLADNQRAVANELSQRGLIRWLGCHDEVDEQAIAQALDKLLQQGLEEDWSLRCRATVDGNGANRVCEALTVTVNTPLRVRHARLDDEDLLLAWANDPATRSNSFSPAPIPAASHRAWFRARLRNLDGCRLYIVETTEGGALGQVRFDRQGQAWEVDYSLAPVFRRRGLGCPLLEAALLKLHVGMHSDLIIVGHVKIGNFPSRKVFESLGFEAQLDEVGGALVYQRVLGRGKPVGAMRNAVPNKALSWIFGKNRKRLLFTGGGGAGSESLSRMLCERYEVHFADADNDAKPYSIPSTHWHQIPFASAPTFSEELNRLCCELKVDLLIPGVDEELLPISQARDTMVCEVLLPSAEFIKTHLDKLKSNSLLLSYGLPAPKTEPLPGHQWVPYPCIVKPRQGRGSRGVAIVHSEQELQAHIVLSRRRSEDFIVQELLVGQEYTVMMAADRTGQLCAVVPVKVGIKKGITLRAETDRDERVIDACIAIHAADPVPGCYNIQLVKTETGDAKPFEINPRISTTSCLGLAAGVNFVDVYLDAKETANSRAEGLLQFQDRLRLRRSWYNEIIA